MGHASVDGYLSQGRVWIKKLTLTNFRNYKEVSLSFSPKPVILIGDNGSGKTNLLEAVSLLGAGKGLRNASYNDLICLEQEDEEGWVVSSQISTFVGEAVIGTALKPISVSTGKRQGRLVRVDGHNKGSTSVLDRYSHIVWLTPSLDGLLTGAAAERRRFLDHLIIGLDPSFRGLRSSFERAMRQRNKLFEQGSTDRAQFESLEIQMAQSGVALGAARLQAVDHLSSAVEKKWHLRDEKAIFPWSVLALNGFIEQDLRTMPAVEAEDHYFQALEQNRERDRAAKRALIGPHRSDFTLMHGAKKMSGHLCSTGEQKALLIGLVLSYVEQVKQLHHGIAPLLLLDEVAAHLDHNRRQELFSQIIALKAQVWMTGTDRLIFASVEDQTQLVMIEGNQLSLV